MLEKGKNFLELSCSRCAHMFEDIYEKRWLKVFKDYSLQVQHLFNAMDEAYQQTANFYGFYCNGCPENCCRSHFYHHSIIEFLYLKEGFDALPTTLRDTVVERARMSADLGRIATDNAKWRRSMCPLNIEERCVLYTYRPMICRLHGIPHTLRLPGGKLITGSGCDLFSRGFLQKGSFRLDRTPIYAELAKLERSFRQSAGISGKLKMTVAQMISAYSDWIKVNNEICRA